MDCDRSAEIDPLFPQVSFGQSLIKATSRKLEQRSSCSLLSHSVSLPGPPGSEKWAARRKRVYLVLLVWAPAPSRPLPLCGMLTHVFALWAAVLPSRGPFCAILWFLLSTCSWTLTAQSLGESALLDRSPGNFSSRNYSSHSLSGPQEMQPVPHGEGSLLFSSLPYFCPLASVSLFSWKRPQTVMSGS